MSDTELADFDRIVGELDGMSDTNLDTLLGKIGAVTPWQGSPAGSLAGGLDPRARDEDGFSLSMAGDDFNYRGYDKLQALCWEKFNRNPFVFTTVMDTTGRLTGYGFDQSSTYPKADDFMNSVWKDPRNMLVLHFNKYIARNVIQGELFFVFTIHKDGFVEVDFLSPTTIKGFNNGSGILTPENKPMFPLLYRVQMVENKVTKTKYIPSINMAYYPEMWKELRKHSEWPSVVESEIIGKDNRPKFKDIGGYTQFVVHFDQGLVTSRNVGRTKVALEWLEHYDNIKKWELDHKKSSGAYLWTVEVEDRAAFRLWLGLSDEQKAMTGLLGKKTPGATLMLPPGFKLTCNNPKLASITNQDDDILRMVSAGLNTSEDQMTGSSSGQTYGGVKMSRGPINDRIQDQVSELQRFMIYGFWRGALFLHSKTGNMPWTVTEERAYKFEDKTPKFKKVKVEAHETISINFPASEMSDLETRVKALLGVKHGAVNKTLGVANEDVANKLGFQNWHKSRLKAATEEKMYPALITNEEVEQLEEGLSEPGLAKTVKTDSPADPPPPPEPPPKRTIDENVGKKVVKKEVEEED
jgi:hypothetical protein